MNFPGSGGLAGGGGDAADPNIRRVQSLMESCYAKTVMSGVAGFGLGGIFGLFMASMAYDTPYHTPMPAPTPAAGAATAGGATAGGAAGATTTTTATAATAATAAAPKAVAATGAGAGAGAGLAAGTATAAATPATAAPRPVVGAGTATTSALLNPTVQAPASVPLRQQLAHGFRDMGSRSYSTAKNFGTVGALFAGIECGIEGLRAKNDMGNGVAAGCLTGAILARNGGPQAAAIGCAGFAAFSAAIDAYLRMPPKDD